MEPSTGSPPLLPPMTLSEHDILHCLMQARTRLSASVWLVVRNTHTAEDIFQNVALKAMTSRATFQSEAALLSWAFITARREGIDWLYRQQREPVTVQADILNLLDNEWMSAPLSSSARIDALTACLDAVPVPGRELLRLRYHEGCTCEEISQRVNLGLDAVYQRLSRLHRRLRECVETRLAQSSPASP